MSIISTMYLKDDIIMSADSRITQTQISDDSSTNSHTLSDRGQKLFLLRDYNVGISSCGIRNIDNMPMEKFIRAFEKQVVSSSDEIYDIVKKLRDFAFRKYQTTVTFHVCGYRGETRKVYRLDDNIPTSLVPNSDNKCGIVLSGDGSTILSKILKSKSGFRVDWNSLSINEGIELSSFLLDMACNMQKFRPELRTCGGPIDILLITKNQTQWVRRKIFYDRNI